MKFQKLVIKEEIPYKVNTAALGYFDKLLDKVIINYNKAQQK